MKAEPSPARADFSIIMECTPEIGHCTLCVLCGLEPEEIDAGKTVGKLDMDCEHHREENLTEGPEGGKSQPRKADKQRWER